MKFIKLTSLLVTLLGATNAFAALSAVVTVSPSSVYINQMVTASVAIDNTGSSMNLSSLSITANYNGVPGSRIPAAFSVLNLGPNSPSIALGGGSGQAGVVTTIPMQAVFFAPSTGITGSGSGKFYVGATFYTSDGSVTSAATAGRVTVNPLPLPASQL